MTTESHESYVRRIAQENAHYVRELLRENQELRDLATHLESERLMREAESSSAAQENRELQATVDRLQAEIYALSTELRTARQRLVAYDCQKTELQTRLQTLQAESRKHLEDYLEVEQQNTNLANLYVAGYRLHSTLDRAEVLAGLQEIIVNLIGSEELAILELDPEGSPRIANKMGLEASSYERLPQEARARVEECLRTQEVWTDDADAGSALTACIPLTVDGLCVGAIVVFRLLQQKPGLEPLDRELFGFLVSQAATALYLTSLHAARMTTPTVM